MARHKRRRKTFRPPSAGDPPEHGGDDGTGERLQKVLAAAGVGSRRDCEELICEGRVEVDRRTVTELGTRVDPLRHEIRVDGEPLRQPTRLYYAVNKPSGVVTTNFDPSGRPRVVDLVPTDERVFAVGRLDRASEGLILVTNDGEFANRITHPRYGVEKTYLVRVAGAPTPADLARLRKGVYLSDGMCRVQSIVAKKRHGKSADLVIVLNEGRNRELRRILARVGHKVLRLKRIAVGPIKLADLPSGAWRRLMPNEIETLLHLAKEKRKASKAKRKRVKTQSGMKPVHGERPQSPYLQQQALMAEPLSLEELLKDDLNEGGVILGAADEQAGDASELHGNSPAGGVIDYQDERAARQSAPSQSPRTPAASRGKKPFRPKSKMRGARQRTDRVAKTGGRKFGKPGGKRFGRPGGKRRPPMNPLHAQFYADQAVQQTVEIVQNLRLARETYRVRFHAPEIARRIVPGQFVMLRLAEVNDPLIGRPLALYDTVLDAAGQPAEIDVVYLVKGKLTSRLWQMQPGQRLEVWGPLGNGFLPLSDASQKRSGTTDASHKLPAVPTEHLIMVAGGIGQTPFLALAQEALHKRRYGDPPRQVPRALHVTLCYGSRTADYLAGVEDFANLGIDVRISTDDGSRGHHGLVTHLLAQVLGEHHGRPRIVCCGPEPMMEAVAKIAHAAHVPCQVSLETPMACGVGICFTCVAKVRQPGGGWDYKRTCVDGPVFDAEAIEW